MKEFTSEQDMLLDALEYYTVDPKNRRCAANHNLTGSSCKYAPETLHKEKTSEGCLIGRCLPREDAIAIDKIGTDNIRHILYAGIAPENFEEDEDIVKMYNHIPEWMKKLDDLFLDDAQRLHDEASNWDEKGLSDKGKEFLQYIISNYGFKKELFEKFLK